MTDDPKSLAQELRDACGPVSWRKRQDVLARSAAYLDTLSASLTALDDEIVELEKSHARKETRNRELREEIARLREALQPFASLGGNWPARYGYGPDDYIGGGITYQMIWDAEAALFPTQEEK